MKICERLILFLYGIFIALVSAMTIIGVIFVEVNQFYYEIILKNVLEFLTYQWVIPSIIIISVIAFIISIKIAIGGTGKKRQEKVVIQPTGGGDIAITIDTFESIVISTLKKIAEAKEYSVSVKKEEEGVVVFINLSILEDVNIPELGDKVQTNTIQAIENIAGVKVLNVRVKIDNICTGFKNKLE